MGWKGYETTIPVGMLFKRMFCHKCGAQLKKENSEWRWVKDSVLLTKL